MNGRFQARLGTEMPTALYYPHTQIRSVSLLKNALLVWDEVQFISPYASFRFDDDFDDDYRESLELICKPHTPSDEEKKAVHQRVLKLLKNGLPSWIVAKKVPDIIRLGRQVREYGDGEFGMYPQKLDHKTWVLLEGAGLVQLSGSDHDYYTRPLVGFFLMSLLADACSGNEIEQITDRADAYGFLWKLVSAEVGAHPITKSNAKDAKHLDRLATLSIKGINADGIPLKNLLALRKREAGTQGHDYRAFRKKYGEKLRQFAVLATSAKSKNDLREIEAQFQLELKDDLASLKDELKVAKSKLVLSKEMATMVVATAGLFVEPFSASVLFAGAAKALAGGALLGDASTYVGNYKKALKDHPTSWLYLAENPKRDIPFADLLRRQS